MARNQNQGGGQRGGNQQDALKEATRKSLLSMLENAIEDKVGAANFNSLPAAQTVVNALPPIFWNTIGSVLTGFTIPEDLVKDPTIRLALDTAIHTAAGAAHGAGDAGDRARRKIEEIVLLHTSPATTPSPPGVGAAAVPAVKAITVAQLEEDEKYLAKLTDGDRVVLVAVFRMLRTDVAQKLEDAFLNHNLVQEGWRGCPPTLLQPALRCGLDAAGQPTEQTKAEVLGAVDVGSRLGNPAASAVAMDRWTEFMTAIKKKDLGLLQKVLQPLNWLGFILLGLFVVWLAVTGTGIYFLGSGFLGGHIVHLFVGISVLLVSVIGMLLAAGAVIGGLKDLIPGGE